MALHGHNESTHWITPSVIKCFFWSIRKYGGQQLLYRPDSFLIRIRAAIKEQKLQVRWWLMRTRLLPWGRFGVDCKEKVGVILSPRKRGGGEGKLYFLLRVKGHLHRMMWQQQMVLEVCKCIYDALKRALRCTSCTLKLKWWPNLKGRILVHPSIMNLLDEFSKNLNNYGDK